MGTYRKCRVKFGGYVMKPISKRRFMISEHNAHKQHARCANIEDTIPLERATVVSVCVRSWHSCSYNSKEQRKVLLRDESRI